MIQLLICTPSPALRAGLRALVAADPDVAVVALVGTLASLPPDLPEVDVLLASPEGAGLPDDPARWPARLPDLPGQNLPALLLITADAAQARALRGLRLPAWGAISPDAPGEALQAAIHALAEGLVVFSAELAEPVDPAEAGSMAGGLPASGAASALAAIAAAADGAAGADGQDGLVEPLTAREREVLLGLAQGLTNKQIALGLGISEHTVKFHVSSIYSKMGAANRTEAVRKGARRGWVPL